MSQAVLLQIILVLLVVAAVPGITFPVLYFFRSPWRSHPVGRVMMVVSSALGLVFALSLLFNFIPNFPGKYVLALGAYAYLDIALWFQLVVLLGIQHRDRRQPTADRRLVDKGRC